MEKLNFENPVFKPILFLFIASSFNDWWAVTIGIPTPVQLALFYGIFVFVFKYKVLAPNVFLKVKYLILFYLMVVVLSSCVMVFLYGELDIRVFTILINLLWLISALPYLSIGFSNKDIILFFKWVLAVVFFVSIPFGVYELITHKNFLNVDYGLAEEMFYVRGLHIDKIEYASMLSIGALVAISFITSKVKDVSLTYLFSLLFFCGGLIVVTYSTTAIVGLVLGTFMILVYGIRKGGAIGVLVLAMFWISFEIVSTTSIFEKLLASYNLKYELNVNQVKERNYRYMSWDAALNQISENPIWGYGIGNSGKVVQKFFIKDLNYFTNQYLNLSKEVNTHNFLFNEFLDYGIVGGLPLLTLLLVFFFYVFSPDFVIYSTEVEVLNKVVIGLSMLLIFRFVLYYHRFDQSIYLLWSSLLLGLRATKIAHRAI